MDWTRSPSTHAALISLETAATAARGGFACMFSTADEYETAVISERRAQGRYDQRRRHWPIAMLAGCVLMMAGTALLLN
jgi:hypothetical protein